MDFKAILGTMQKKLQDVKERKEKARYKGEAGAGAVSVTINGDFYIIPEEVEISDSLKGEDCDVIADMFSAAYNNARELAKKDEGGR